MSHEDLLEKQTFCQYELDQMLDETDDVNIWRKHIFNYLEKNQSSGEKYCIPNKEFDEAGVEWLNVSTPLKCSIHLRGRVAILDFFTYCCINCMHILPYLHKLEREMPASEVVVVGIHSAKFENEKSSENVKRAIIRYGIDHPVLNDPEMKLWSLCQIICWPTLVVLGPDGSVVYKFIGEKYMHRFTSYVQIFLDYFKSIGQLVNTSPLPKQTLKEFNNGKRMRCPGKVAVNNKYLAVSDSTNHRIIVFDKENYRVSVIVGSGEAGLQDGSFEECRFNSPQGICWALQNLYVADTGNHAIREINFETKTIITIAGNGVQGRDLNGGKNGTSQEISSPWDLVLYSDDLLLIAMAGTHQVWAYAISENHQLFNGKATVQRGQCVCLAGSGREENRNTSYPLKAGFAQPSGLTLDNEQKFLYLADSESSTVRVIEMTSGSVKNVCGGDVDPLNLFAFGDKDGKAVDAKLQHPLGIAWNHLNQRVIIVDSYNHKLKEVDPKSRRCETTFDEQLLNEPGGLAVDQTTNRLYVADTDNNEVKIFLLPSVKLIGSIGPELTVG